MRSGARIAAAAAALALTLSLALPGVAAADRTLSLSTGKERISLAPGRSASGTIVAANNGKDPLMALIYAADMRVDSGGVATYERPAGQTGAFLQSPASWIELAAPDSTKILANTPYVALQPGQKLSIRYTLRVPKDVAPGDYNAVIFFHIFDQASLKADKVQVTGRVGTRISLRVVGKVVDKLSIEPFTVGGLVIGDIMRFGLTLSDSGNVDKPFTAKLLVVGNDGKTRSLVETSGVVFADSRREYSGGVELDGFGLGRYTVRAQVDYSKETGKGKPAPATLTEERRVTVLPIWFVVMFTAALVGLAALLVTLSLKARASRKPRTGRHSAPRRGTSEALPPRRSERRRRGARPRPPRPVVEDDDWTPPDDWLPKRHAAEEPERQAETLREPAEQLPLGSAEGDMWAPDDLFGGLGDDRKAE